MNPSAAKRHPQDSSSYVKALPASIFRHPLGCGSDNVKCIRSTLLTSLRSCKMLCPYTNAYWVKARAEIQMHTCHYTTFTEKAD